VTVDTDIVGGDDENNAQYYSPNFANRDIRNLVGKMIDVKTFRIFSPKIPKQGNRRFRSLISDSLSYNLVK
jgi:hypothetical protein